MGKVYLSPNPIKTSERLDKDGNVINPITKQVIVPREEEYVAPPSMTSPETPQTPIVKEQNKVDISSKIEELVNKRIEEIITKKVEEALKKL